MRDDHATDPGWLDLLAEEFDAAWQAGQRPRLEDFRARVPPARRQVVVQELLPIELHHRIRGGEQASASEYQRRLPEHAETVSDIFARMHGATARRTPRSTQRVILAAGARLGDYVIDERIGQGGMGEVYRARHERMQRDVAIKVLNGEEPAAPLAVRRFEREIHATAQMTHENLVRAYDAGERDGVVYLVMELIVGRSLHQLVLDGGPLPPDVAVAYAAQAARGLAYVHGQGLVHRDIKPSNLMLDAGGTIKILDLGLTSFREHCRSELDADAESLTATGLIMGTVDYMAPEQALHSSLADHRADIYSLGCTLHFLLTGKPPYAGRTLAERLVAHRETPFPRLPGMPAGLEQVVQRMLAKSPEQRQPSMDEVIADLGRVLRGEPVPTTRHILEAPPTVAPSITDRSATLPPSSRRRSYAVASIAGVSVLVVCAVLIGMLWRDPQTQGTSPQVPPSKVNGYADFPADMPFDKQVEWLKAELARLNPGFDPKKVKAELSYGSPNVHLEDQSNLLNLAPLARMKDLDCLTLRDSHVKNLEPLAGLRLKMLDLGHTLVADLTPLKKVPLRTLVIYGTKVTSLEPLAGSSLTELDCHNTDIEDIAPLASTSLEDLNAGETRIADLSPLPKTVVSLRIDKTRVRDLNTVKHLRLKRLWCDEEIAQAHPFLRKMESLEEINDAPAAAFWKKVDGK